MRTPTKTLKTRKKSQTMRLDLFIVKSLQSLLCTSGLSESVCKKLLALPRAFWQKEINSGNIKLGNKIPKPSFNIDDLKKSQIKIDWKKIKKNWEQFHKKKLVPQKIKIEFLKIYPELLVVNKPAGIAVHPTFPISREKKREVSLIEGITYKYPEILKAAEANEEERPGIVHRLDKNTSGVLLVARNLNSKRRLKKQFQDRIIKKTYLALVEGGFPYDKFEITSQIGKLASNPLRRGVNNLTLNGEEKKVTGRLINPKASITRGERVKDGGPEGKIIKTWLKHIKKKNKFTILRLFPETGRTHQIRVHLGSLGYPIVGDRLYGSPINLSNFHCLHSHKISWKKPNGKAVSAVSDSIILF